MNDISEAERQKRINRLKFNWHENLSADPVLRKFPTAVALANHIQHRFRADRGYAEISIRGAAKALNMPPRSVCRARKILERRGWIRLAEAWKPGRPGWSANRYILTGGPDDLILDAHGPIGASGGDAADEV